jgi:uncharacterized protein YecT (DUF1311 family)
MQPPLIQALLVALTIMIAPLSASANAPDCRDPQTQTEMNICAGLDYEAADRDLNAVYQRVRASVREQDAEMPANLRGIEAMLIAGQRGWIAYRDGHCGVVGAEARGGTMESMLVSSCMADLTRKRTTELQSLLPSR